MNVVLLCKSVLLLKALSYFAHSLLLMTICSYFCALVCYEVFNELMLITEQKVLEVRLHDLTEELSEMWDSLMGLELQLVDQLEVSKTNIFVNSVVIFTRYSVLIS